MFTCNPAFSSKAHTWILRGQRDVSDFPGKILERWQQLQQWNIVDEQWIIEQRMGIISDFKFLTATHPIVSPCIKTRR